MSPILSRLLRPLPAALCLLLASALDAQRCSLSSFGRPCAATLTGTISRAPAVDLTVRTVGLTSGLLLAGTAPRTFRLPAGCTLHLDPRVAVLFRTDATGAARFSLPIPAGFRGRVLLQAIPILRARPGVILRASNRLDLTCR